MVLVPIFAFFLRLVLPFYDEPIVREGKVGRRERERHRERERKKSNRMKMKKIGKSALPLGKCSRNLFIAEMGARSGR